MYVCVTDGRTDRRTDRQRDRDQWDNERERQCERERVHGETERDGWMSERCYRSRMCIWLARFSTVMMGIMVVIQGGGGGDSVTMSRRH